MLTYNVLNDYVERLKKKDMPIVASTDNVTTLTTDDINSLRAGDIIVKTTGNQKHTYIVSYKENNQGICLTYTDASVVETVSYDYNSETHAWVYNSTDVMPIQHSLTAGDNVSITNNVISATDTTYTAGTGINITDGVISSTVVSGEVWESLVHVGNNTNGYLCFHLTTKEQVTASNVSSILHSELDNGKNIPCYIIASDADWKHPRVTINNVLTEVFPVLLSYSSVGNPMLLCYEPDVNNNITLTANAYYWEGYYGQKGVFYSHKIN